MSAPQKKRRVDNDQMRALVNRLESYMNVLESYGERRSARILEHALLQAIEFGNYDFVMAIENSKMMPVCIDEFLEDDQYLGKILEVWPRLREDLRVIKPDIMTGAPAITEILNRSCIGTGKSIIGQVSILYDIYFLTCFEHPQKLFSNLMRYTPIVFVMQSTKPHITKRVLYEPLRQIYEDVPYFKKYTKWDKDKESTLVLEQGIQLVPMVADAAHFLGQAVIGGHIDEANFMEVVAESSRVSSTGGKGGLYDQAESVYRNITARRLSRFQTNGPNPGGIYVSSSVNYKGDFLDRRINNITPDDKNVYLMDYRLWDVKPHKYSSETFDFLLGTDDYPAKVLPENAKEGIDYPKSGNIMKIPMDFYQQFKTDPEISQRDFAGVASNAISRYISQVHKIVDSIIAGREYGLKSFVENQNIVLTELTKMFVINEANLPDDRDLERFVHIDLSRTGDRLGIAMTKILGYQAINIENVVEKLPVYCVEFAASIEPSSIYQIDIPEIRRFVMTLSTYYGFNIKCVSYDGFDSQESIQLLRKAGIQSMVISMDKTTEAYDLYKDALYQDRVLMVENNIAQNELAQLQKIEQGGKTKIDHPVMNTVDNASNSSTDSPTGRIVKASKGSKDIADAIAGSIKSASINRSTRAKATIVDAKGEAVQRTTQRRRVERRNPGGKPKRK